MKKFLAIILSLTMLISFSACSQETNSGFTAAWGKSNVDETSIYKITIMKSDEDIFVGAPTLEGEGEYIQTLTGDYTNGYVVETSLQFDGSFNFDGRIEDYSQTITSKVKYLDISGKLAPVYSEKSYDGKTIVYNSESETFSSKDLVYSSSVSYEDGKAYVKISDAAGNEISPGIATENTISLGKTTVYDNEQIFQLARALIKDNASSLSFSMLHPMEDSLVSMTLNLSAPSENVEDTALSITLNDELQTFNTLSATISKSMGSDAGSPIILVFALDDVGNIYSAAGNVVESDKSRILKIITQVPYTASAFEYTLESYYSNLYPLESPDAELDEEIGGGDVDGELAD